MEGRHSPVLFLAQGLRRQPLHDVRSAVLMDRPKALLLSKAEPSPPDLNGVRVCLSPFLDGISGDDPARIGPRSPHRSASHSAFFRTPRPLVRARSTPCGAGRPLGSSSRVLQVRSVVLKVLVSSPWLPQLEPSSRLHLMRRLRAEQGLFRGFVHGFCTLLVD